MSTQTVPEHMTQLDYRCWTLVHALTGLPYKTDDGLPHYRSEDAAMEDRRTIYERLTQDDPDHNVVLVAAQEGEPCVIGPDCYECDVSFNDWMDSWPHLDTERAERDVASNDWVKTTDGWLCGNCLHKAGLPKEDDE